VRAWWAAHGIGSRWPNVFAPGGIQMQSSELPSSDRTRHLLWRLVMGAALLSALAVQTLHGWELQKAGTQGYLIGDWTISYAGGFLRRGLFGSLLMGLFPAPPQALFALFVAQTAFYAVIFGVVLRWIALVGDPKRWAIVMLSPAFLMFGVNDLGGTHRKEIIALAGLLLLAQGVIEGRWTFGLSLIAALLFVVAVLSHEANALLVPPFVVLLMWGERDGALGRRTARALIVGFVGIAVAGLASALARPGSASQRELICEDLTGRGFAPELCLGSLRYIGSSTRDGLLKVAETSPQILIYVVPAILAAVALSHVPWVRRNLRLLVAVNIGITPLFLVAVDWGRWVMLIATVSTIMAFVGSVREGSVPDEVPLRWVLIYVMAWRIPHVGASWSELGPGLLIPRTIRLVESLAFVVRRVFA